MRNSSEQLDFYLARRVWTKERKELIAAQRVRTISKRGEERRGGRRKLTVVWKLDAFPALTQPFSPPPPCRLARLRSIGRYKLVSKLHYSQLAVSGEKNRITDIEDSEGKIKDHETVPTNKVYRWVDEMIREIRSESGGMLFIRKKCLKINLYWQFY